MTDREEIDMLRREVADLRERLRAVEARPVTPVIGPVYAPTLPPFMPRHPTWPSPFVTTCIETDLGKPINVFGYTGNLCGARARFAHDADRPSPAKVA